MTSDEGATASADGEARARVAVGLGSNRGNRAAHLAAGVEALETLLSGLRCSRVYETVATGEAAGQPSFLNMCCVGAASLDPGPLLDALLRVEREAGRIRPPGPEARPRTLDLDLLLYGDRVVDRPGLRVPHPRMDVRAFVLVPLSEVAPEWRHPVTGRTVEEMAGGVPADGVVPLDADLPAEVEARVRPRSPRTGGQGERSGHGEGDEDGG